MIGDVTPVGWPSGETRRKRGPLRILIGLALLVGGAVALVIGISGAVTARSAIEDNAVARAPLGQPTSFRADAGQRYTVYVIFSGGVFSNTDRQDAIIARTACETSSGASLKRCVPGVERHARERFDRRPLPRRPVATCGSTAPGRRPTPTS